MSIVFVGAYQGTRHWGDIFTLLAFGTLGWFMKRLGWPRPPLILGVVLGVIVERYLFFSINRYGWEWLWKEPYVVPIVFAISLTGLISPFWKEWRRAGGADGWRRKFSARPRVDGQLPAYLLGLLMFGFWISESTEWAYSARLAPLTVSVIGLGVVVAGLLNHLFRKSAAELAAAGEAPEAAGYHLDLQTRDTHLSRAVVARRATAFMGFMLSFVALTALFGMLAAVFLFVLVYMRLEAKEPWRIAVPCAAVLLVFCVIVFDRILHLPWPEAAILDVVIEARRAILYWLAV